MHLDTELQHEESSACREIHEEVKDEGFPNLHQICLFRAEQIIHFFDLGIGQLLNGLFAATRVVFSNLFQQLFIMELASRRMFRIATRVLSDFAIL